MNLKESVGLQENLEENKATARRVLCSYMGVTDSVGGLSEPYLFPDLQKIGSGPWLSLVY